MRHRILYYAETEGGFLIPWPDGYFKYIEDWELEQLQRATGAHGWIRYQGIKIHMLLDSKFYRWDCENGWCLNEPERIKEREMFFSNAFRPNFDSDSCSACGKQGIELADPDFQCWYAFCPIKKLHVV